MKLAIFWFRRDLRLNDNTALHYALQSELPVLPIFIFDPAILNELALDDPRVTFIYEILARLRGQIGEYGGALNILQGDPVQVLSELTKKYTIGEVFFNKDYEPFGQERDKQVADILSAKGIKVKHFKDHVIFEEKEVVKKDGLPYTVYSPYKRKWRELYASNKIKIKGPSNYGNFYKSQIDFPSLADLGFKSSSIKVKDVVLDDLERYEDTRNFPNSDTSSYLGPHLRFGTVSIREIALYAEARSPVFLDQLVWRDFFMQILFHFPQVVNQNFKAKYNQIEWHNCEAEFELWCEGRTGYPLIDAGMRQLNQTGYMHNRVRMVVAGFLCKNLLIDWRLGEAYFAKKLLDYELASNNGNWQWAAGTGCDAAPYFRVFNPSLQLIKFDQDHLYVSKWIPNYDRDSYLAPIVDYSSSRKRAIETYRSGLGAE